MAHILTSFLTFHWAVAFALLAAVCVMGGDGGLMSGLEMLGVTLSDHAVQTGGTTAVAAAFFALTFAICGVLFLWAFLTAFFSGRDFYAEAEEVTRIAFGTSIGALSLLVVYGSTQPLIGLYPVVGVQLAALLASYLAIVAERGVVPKTVVRAEDQSRSAMRIMAVGAANDALLSRLSGRLTVVSDRSR